MAISISRVIFSPQTPSGEDCQICWKALNETDGEMVIGHSGKVIHQYHLKCIAPWFSEQSLCPTCKAEVENAHVYAQTPTDEQISRIGLNVIAAAKQGNLQDLQRLLRNTITEEDRGIAITEAVEHDQPGTIIEILLINGPISSRLRGWAVVSAALKNNLNSLRILLSNGPIPVNYKSAALECAHKHSNQEMILILEQSVSCE